MSAGISAALTMSRPPVAAPEGRVTLVATAVRGLRELWDSQPEATSAGLRLTSAMLKRLLVDYQGYEVRTDGEALLVAFSTPLAAARWCLAAQDALLEAEWPDALLSCDGADELLDSDGNLVFRGLRVGMGVHTGEPDALVDVRTKRTDFAGDSVTWVQQMASAARGGQILLSTAAFQALSEDGADQLEAEVSDLGRHRFPGREDAQGLVQILPWRLANRTFAEVQTGFTLRTNLPADPGLFVGRERLLGAIDRYVQGGRKVVTLKGHGGIGKTRLALRYAGLHVHEYGDGGGVWFCDLSGARSIDAICHVVARALGVPLRAKSMQGTQQLAAALKARGRCLLILDNFEQVAQYAEYTVGLWVRKAPRLRILVTSRHRLHVKDEAVLEVTPLDTDEAEALFESRAQWTRPGLEILDHERPMVREILERVDSIPLAVELAAAWLGMLTIEGVLQRLKQGQEALEGVEVDSVHPRHYSLQHVMTSSWELLEPWAQEALICCAVFRGGFTVDEAEKVIDLRRYRSAPSVFDALKELRDRSLVQVAQTYPGSAEVRWHLYDSVTEFASKRLAASGLRPTVERRHAKAFLALGADALDRLRGPEGKTAMAEIAVEVDNLLAVHERTLGKQPRLALQAALVLDPILSTRGPFDLHLKVLEDTEVAAMNVKGEHQIPVRMARIEALVARGRLQEAMEAVDAARGVVRSGDSATVKAWVSALSGWTLTRIGRVDDGATELRKARQDLGKDGHPHEPVAAYRLGRVLLEGGEVEEAATILQEALNLAKSRKDAWLEADVLATLGDLARHRGFHARAGRHYEAALEHLVELGDRPREAQVIARKGSLALDLRNGEEAEVLFRQAREAAELVGDRLEVAVIDGNLGRMMHHDGRGAEAREAYDSAIRALAEAGATRWLGIYRGILAALLHEQGHTEEAFATYRAAKDGLERCGARRFAGLVWARTGALYADGGQGGEAEAAFARAQEHLEAVQDPMGLAALDVHRGHLDLAKARAGQSGALEKARERFRAATAPAAEGNVVAAPAAVSNDVRLALRLLKRSMELGKGS